MYSATDVAPDPFDGQPFCGEGLAGQAGQATGSRQNRSPRASRIVMGNARILVDLLGDQGQISIQAKRLLEQAFG